MKQRLYFSPFYRINKSVLFLGLKWEDVLPAVSVFLVIQFILNDLFISFILAGFIIFISAILRRKHRQKILRDVVLSLFEKDVIYVSKDRIRKS